MKYVHSYWMWVIFWHLCKHSLHDPVSRWPCAWSTFHIIIAHFFQNTFGGFLLGSPCGLCFKGLKEGKSVSDGEPWLVIIPYGTELCKQLLLAEQHVPRAEKTELERETAWVRENAREGSSLIVWKIGLCRITRLTLLPVCCTSS